MNRRTVLVLQLCFFWLLLLGAVHAEEQHEPSKERLLERAHSYWEAAKIRDMATVYSLEAGALVGQLKPETMRRAAESSRLLSYELKEVEIDGEDAVIQIDGKYSLSGLKSTFSQQRDDPWIFIKGDWYHGKSLRSANADKAQ